MKQVRVGVIGLGFMGATHIAAYKSAQAAGYPCALVAVADPKEHRRRGELGDVGGNIATGGAKERAFDPSAVRGYERAEQLLDDTSVDLVSICSRTDTHVELAKKALAAGKHVLIEKPVGLTVEEIQSIAEVERKSGKIAMPAMCMRYWPGWTWLKERVRDRSLGKCLRGSFTRLAGMPGWSRSFFLDGSKSGSGLFDVHIHDADFVRWCFGEPQSVSACGRIGASGGVDYVNAVYRFDGPGPEVVVAEGGFDHHAGFAFRMRYVAVFEQGTADFDLARSPQLVLCREGKAEEIRTDGPNGYEGQARALLTVLTGKSGENLPTLGEALGATRLLIAERESALRS